ncbi:hypothetical protein KKH96_02635, partial [Patescibacteria group bacterium]|nr:hypothetical protein [Patescibacteria group bacterium]
MKINKLKPCLISFLQALGVVVYCFLIGSFLQLGERFFPQPPVFLLPVLILTLLVFSAAVTGMIVFGYPAYLALNNRIKEALIIFLYTLLYFLGFIGIMII